jgi:type II secretory pathway component PulF
VKYSYSGYEKSGAPARGVVEAADRNEAAEQLRKRGIFATEVKEAAGSSGAAGVAMPPKKRGGFGAGKRLEHVASFMRQLALLVSTGTPLVEALCSLERQVLNPDFKAVLTSIRSRVEEGVQLSEAMAQHPEYFDAVCRSLVCAGEQGGKLEVMLERLSQLIRQQVKIRKTVRGAMLYPLLLVGVAIIVVTALLGFVLPRFEGLFKTLDTPLPTTTVMLMSISNGLRAFWWAVLGAVITAGVGLKLWLGSEPGRRWWDGFVLVAPQLGKVSRSFATARIARMLGTLLDGKVALLDSLELTKQSMANSRYIALIGRAQDAVTRGENVSAALSDPALIHASVYDALRSAERTGRMSTVLVTLADHMDEDNEALVKTLTGLLEPIILICLGLIVGLVAISMFLPLFDLTAAAGGGA